MKNGAGANQSHFLYSSFVHLSMLKFIIIALLVIYFFSKAFRSDDEK
jgi:hypothetical protein